VERYGWCQGVIRAGLLGAALGLAAQSVPEYQSKLVLMDKLTRFVEWPSAANPDRAFVLAVLGRSPFGEDLEGYFPLHPLKYRPVTIRYLRQAQELGDIDLLFICASERPRLAQELEQVKGRPVLTVADTEGFVQAGVMVGFVHLNGKITFEVNPAAVREAGIRVRPDFLQLAKIVQ